MLSIGKIALGQHAYYEQQVAQGRDDYYAGRGEAPGEWVGAGAEALGLSGRVTGEQFTALLAGLDPADPARRLRSTARDPRVAALDLTFSAPKSVSVLAAVGPDALARELIVAHELAVRAALGYLEDGAVQVRRGRDGYIVEPGEGLVAAAYRHRMSRALDPQLHTHIVAANMTRGPDGRYTALHGAQLYRAAKTAGYLYQAHLRALVSDRIGLAWGPVIKGAAELQAVPQLVLEEFSKRRQEMLRAAQGGGIGLDSKAAAESAALATRDRKRYGVDTHTWREEVRARAGELGLGTRELAQIAGDGRSRVARGPRRRAVDEAALADHLASPTGLTERQNTFDERKLLQEFAAAAQSGARVELVRGQAERFAQRPDVLATTRGEMTTAELVECERRLVDAALVRAGERTGVIQEKLLARVVAEAQWPLTDEQARAVTAVAESGRGVEVVEALAGTGKTYIAGILREAYERAGHEVLGVAPTGRGARELSEQAHIPAQTLDQFLLDLERVGGEPLKRSVVIFDEAGMAPTRSTARLFEAAQRAGAKVIAIGDPGQLSSVRAGGWLRHLAHQLGSLRLTEVMRQRDGTERRALAALHDGHSERYINWAERSQRIETFDHRSDALERALHDWAEAAGRAGLKEAVMIARDNHTRDQLNDAARELLGALGLLGDELSYDGLPLAVGDRVICRRNDRMLDLDNGTRGTVRALDEHRVVMETDSHLVRELPAGYVTEHVEYAYALTGHGMQGATVESAIVLASPRDLTAGWSYTALSRARGSTRLLIHEQQPARERAELAPSEHQRTGDRDALLAAVTRRMRERDSEDLAIEQLEPAGRSEDPELALAQRLVGEPHQERSAAASEPPDPRRPVALRESLEALRAQRRALPIHKLQQLDDADARLIALSGKRDQLGGTLHDLRAPSRRLGRSRSNGSEIQRARLSAALNGYDQALEQTRAQRARLERELGDPEQVRSERDGLDRAIEEIEREYRAHGQQPGEREPERSRHALTPEHPRAVERSGGPDHDIGL
jgi:conjugative relaxase-like TrwC/TraI family protein